MEGQLRLGGKKIADHPTSYPRRAMYLVVLYVLHVYLGPILGEGRGGMNHRKLLEEEMDAHSLTRTNHSKS